MLIGTDIREWQPGAHTGIGRFLEELLLAAQATMAEERVLLVGDSTCEVRVQAPNMEVVRIPDRWTPWSDQISLPRLLARREVSVFLSPYYKGPLLAPCPVVLTIHDLFFIGYPGRRRPLYDAFMTRLARLYARRATAIIADSDYSKRRILERLGITPAKVSVIPVALGLEFRNTPLTDQVRARYAITEPYILYLGAFKPHKNLPRLLQAFAGLDASLRSAHQLVLAGGDRASQQTCLGLARSLGIAGRVVVPGQIHNRDLPALYSGCALFVLPSLEEGFGLPALEAMACGAPVIASNRGAIPEVVGEAAMLFDPENVQAITAAIARVLTHAELKASLRQQGLAQAGKFSRAATATRVLALLRDIGAGNPRNG
ncbi:MAG: glycosyltransferase family 4 protein [Candidatus Methylomirabilis sp.]